MYTLESFDRGMKRIITGDVTNPDGSPFNLTGYRVRMVWKYDAKQPDSEIKLDIEGEIVSALGGTWRIIFLKADTKDLIPRDYVWELLFYDSLDEVQFKENGVVALTKGILDEL